MQREEHLLGELHAYRYRADNPKYALVGERIAQPA